MGLSQLGTFGVWSKLLRLQQFSRSFCRSEHFCVALNHISNTKKSTISWKIIFYTDFLNVYNLTSRLLTGLLRPYLLMGDLYGSANDPRTANDPGPQMIPTKK